MGPGESRTIVQIPVGRIGVRPGRRPLDEAHVANLQVSIGEIGQRQPIQVQRVADGDPARERFSWWLTAGAHRLDAVKRLGRRVIDAVIEEDDELVARIAEVDENLIRRDYDSLERAQALAARLDAWGAKYPARVAVDADGQTRAKRGRPKMGHGAPISGEAPPTMGFAEDAAATTGLSADTVKRSLAIYRGIPAGLQEKLAGTAIAKNPGLLRQLAALGDRREQAKVADLLIDGNTKSVSDARAIAAGNQPSKPVQTPVDDVVRAFRAVWGKASPSARAAILHELSGKKLPAGYTVSQDVR